jgi:quinoprotein dehydrogenase-associated probable ABC transporter substrate-binding protein
MKIPLLLALALPLVLAAPAARSERALRVCADPDALPYSDASGEGLDLEVARIVADDLGLEGVEPTWWAQRRGFFRNTLKAGRCDVVVSVPEGIELAATTRPWYRSTFAFVTRTDRGIDVASLDDPRLRTLTIGVPVVGDDGANPPPAAALARRGIVDNVRGFHVYADRGEPLPRAAAAVARGAIDVAILWGPIAAWAASRSDVPLAVVPVAEEQDGGEPIAFSIAMGVRRGDDALRARLDAAIARQRPRIDEVLRRHGVPLR